MFTLDKLALSQLIIYGLYSIQWHLSFISCKNVIIIELPLLSCITAINAVAVLELESSKSDQFSHQHHHSHTISKGLSIDQHQMTSFRNKLLLYN